MASGRRGGPPDIKSTLGSLLRTTLDQASAVRDVLEEQTRSRGGLLDQALMQRKRNAAFAKLGEQIYRLARQGELGELLLEPEIGLLIGELEALDDHERDGAMTSQHAGSDAVSSSEYAARRQSEGRDAEDSQDYRVWRPVRPDVEPFSASDQEPMTSEGAPPEIEPPERPSRRSPRGPLHKGGGIHFAHKDPSPEHPDSDEDLASYMHDDDVPEG